MKRYIQIFTCVVLMLLQFSSCVKIRKDGKPFYSYIVEVEGKEFYTYEQIEPYQKYYSHIFQPTLYEPPMMGQRNDNTYKYWFHPQDGCGFTLFVDDPQCIISGKKYFFKPDEEFVLFKGSEEWSGYKVLWDRILMKKGNYWFELIGDGRRSYSIHFEGDFSMSLEAIEGDVKSRFDTIVPTRAVLTVYEKMHHPYQEHIKAY
ncbi:MAG: hypothetical protein J6O51_07550 [Bacteroidales bacterium]|nr:hypothetical protein [Bacteroidales bacterium]